MCIGVLLALSTSYASEVQRWDFATYKSHMDNASSSDRFLIAFTATWCGHCKRLKPTFRSLAKTLEGKVTVVDIEAPDEKALASLFNIEGFPKIFLITDWEVREYEGSRSHDDLTRFCEEGYKDVEPMPFIWSPFGPIGKIHFAMTSIGNQMLQFQKWILGETLGFGTKVFIGLFAVFLFSAIGIFVVGAIVMAEERRDANKRD